jgi:hypothetical protein
MVESAGNKIIVKVGEFIGEQAQMYDTKKRTTNIELEFPHALVRTKYTSFKKVINAAADFNKVVLVLDKK